MKTLGWTLIWWAIVQQSVVDAFYLPSLQSFGGVNTGGATSEKPVDGNSALATVTARSVVKRREEAEWNDPLPVVRKRLVPRHRKNHKNATSTAQNQPNGANLTNVTNTTSIGVADAAANTATPASGIINLSTVVGN